MKCLTILLLYLYFKQTRGVEPSMRNYLLDRMHYVNEEFSRLKRSSPDAHQQSIVHFGESHVVRFENATEAHTFDLFGRNYLLSDGELYYVAPEENKYILTAIESFPEMRDEIAFIKTTDHAGVGFMFVCFVHDTVSHVYRFANDMLEPRTPIQTIKTINKLTDATFFVSHGSLYLAISSVLGVSMAPVVVYKWEKSHFDDIDKVYVDGAIGLSTFPNFDSASEILIVLRNNELESSNSYVYEFDADKLRKIQILDDVRSTRLLTFTSGNHIYLVVFNDAPTSTLYRWSHNEFILLHQFEVQPNVQQVFLSVQEDVPLIATVTKNDMMVFTLITDTIQHLRTHHLEPNFIKILSMRITQFFGEKVVLILGLTEYHELNFMYIPISLTKVDIVSSLRQSYTLNDCLTELDDAIDQSNDVEVPSASKTHEKTVQLPKKIAEGDAEEFTPGANVDAALRQSTPEVFSINEDLQKDMDQVLGQLKQLEDKSQILLPRLSDLLSKNDVVIDSKVIIQGTLQAGQLTGKSIRSKKLNGLTWEPERWLSTSGDQLIATPMHVQSLKASELEVKNDNGLFRDTPLSNAAAPGNRTLAGVMRVASLKAVNIFAPRINDVDMRSLYLRRAPARITGNKSFNNVRADDAHAATLNGKNTSEAIKLFGDPKARQYEFQPLVTVKNLEAETINDVDWRTFAASAFRVGGDEARRTIRGDVTLANVKVQFLRPELIGGVRVEDLLTTATPQTVNSIVHLRSVHAPNVDAQRINGLDFAHDVATVSPGAHALISGPVTMKTMRITGDLAIDGSLDEFYKRNSIVGTHERDLLQIYNNKVRINGDLRLPDAELARAAKLFISGNEFNQASFADYWLKTTNQEIPVHFEAHAGIATPHLNAKLLNDIPIEDYMVNDARPPTKATAYVFENVTIVGNVIVDRTKRHQPDLRRLNAEAVKLNGTYVVRGNKKFHAQISIENLKADKLNSVQAGELLTQTASNIVGSKTIRNLTVQSASVNNLTLQQLNSIDLRELKSRAVFIDQPLEIANVDFESLTANHLFAEKINNKLFNEYLVELNRLHQLDALNKLEIRGNATIAKAQRVVYINSVDMKAIIEKMEKGGRGDDPVLSNLFFDGEVRVKELFVRFVNDINVEDLVQQLYYRNWDQNVTARHSFKVLHAANVYTPQINNIRTTHLINVKSTKIQVLQTTHGLKLVNPTFGRSLITNITQCDVHAAMENIHDVPKRVWSSVVVDNITLTEESPLSRLVTNAVCAKRDNIILAPTRLNHANADAVFSGKQINGIDLHRIVSDALTYNATDQVVTGAKEFVKLHTAAMGVEGNTAIPIVNGIDISKLDDSILDASHLNAPIQGKKTFFGGVQADRLTAPVASGVLPDNLVSLETLRSIPRATFDDLTVLNQLTIGMVNSVNFSKFLDDRLLVDAGHDQIATANYYFDALQLNGQTAISNINDIELDDVVFDEGLQVINAPKKFNQGLEVQGDAIIEVLNGIPLSDLYQQSILLQEEAHILGNIDLEAPSQITGDIRAKSINGIPFEHIRELLRSENHRVRIEIINDALHQIEGLVSQNSEMLKRLPHEYLYLEKSVDFQVQVEHAHDVQVVEKNDGVLLHVHTSLPGETCGLPAQCKCLGQETVNIQSGTTNRFLENKYDQRIYSYRHLNIIVDVITNTRSKNKLCSTNSSQEYTSVNSYMFPEKSDDQNPETPNRGKTYSFPEHITGYISDVKFFALDGYVYVILAKLYDSAPDTTELDSLVLGISQETGQVEHVQKLKTNGASTLHVFHTAQGVNLVIGNMGSGLFYETLTTEIYTFDQRVKMFQLLRLVPTTGCTSATSVVLGVDSLIILAQKNSPLQVLKYNPFYDNYYFHETFLHDLPVSSVSVFYTGDFGRSDAYLTAVTDKGHFYIYSYHYLIGWKSESQGQMEGITALVPLEIGNKHYLFAPSSSTTSTLLTVVTQGI